MCSGASSVVCSVVERCERCAATSSTASGVSRCLAVQAVCSGAERCVAVQAVQCVVVWSGV